MRECAFAIAIAEGPDAGHIRPQLVVDLNVTAFIRHNAGIFEPKVVGIGTAADGQ